MVLCLRLENGKESIIFVVPQSNSESSGGDLIALTNFGLTKSENPTKPFASNPGSPAISHPRLFELKAAHTAHFWRSACAFIAGFVNSIEWFGYVWIGRRLMGGWKDRPTYAKSLVFHHVTEFGSLVRFGVYESVALRTQKQFLSDVYSVKVIFQRTIRHELWMKKI